VKKVFYCINIGKLRANYREEAMLIGETLKVGNYLTQHIQGTTLDLHLCSYPLAKSLCQYIFEVPIFVLLIIIFGRATHHLRNQGKMRQRVEFTLAESALASAVAHWRERRVIIQPA
jgi:hypothetical protein